MGPAVDAPPPAQDVHYAGRAPPGGVLAIGLEPPAGPALRQPGQGGTVSARSSWASVATAAAAAQPGAAGLTASAPSAASSLTRKNVLAV